MKFAYRVSLLIALTASHSVLADDVVRTVCDPTIEAARVKRDEAGAQIFTALTDRNGDRAPLRIREATQKLGIAFLNTPSVMRPLRRKESLEGRLAAEKASLVQKQSEFEKRRVYLVEQERSQSDVLIRHAADPEVGITLKSTDEKELVAAAKALKVVQAQASAAEKASRELESGIQSQVKKGKPTAKQAEAIEAARLESEKQKRIGSKVSGLLSKIDALRKSRESQVALVKEKSTAEKRSQDQQKSYETLIASEADTASSAMKEALLGTKEPKYFDSHSNRTNAWKFLSKGLAAQARKDIGGIDAEHFPLDTETEVRWDVKATVVYSHAYTNATEVVSIYTDPSGIAICGRLAVPNDGSGLEPSHHYCASYSLPGGHMSESLTVRDPRFGFEFSSPDKGFELGDDSARDIVKTFKAKALDYQVHASDKLAACLNLKTPETLDAGVDASSSDASALSADQ